SSINLAGAFIHPGARPGPGGAVGQVSAEPARGPTPPAGEPAPASGVPAAASGRAGLRVQRGHRARRRTRQLLAAHLIHPLRPPATLTLPLCPAVARSRHVNEHPTSMASA